MIKEYTAMVRKEEEARMRARDLKVMKKQAVLLDRNEDVYDRIILHLIGADGVAPEVGQRVYCLKLHAGDQEVARIDVGDPAAPVHEARLVHDVVLAVGGVVQMGHSRLSGKGTVTFHVEKLALGRSAYVASVAIFKFLRADGREPESYHVLDRAIHFQVLQDLGDTCERGVCIQPFRAELEAR